MRALSPARPQQEGRIVWGSSPRINSSDVTVKPKQSTGSAFLRDSHASAAALTATINSFFVCSYTLLPPLR